MNKVARTTNVFTEKEQIDYQNKQFEQQLQQALSLSLLAQPTQASSQTLKQSQRIQNQSEKQKQSNNIKDSGPIGLMLAKSFEEDKHQVKGWLMSEKLDGVRCYWNGSKMYTRNGNLFYPPKWFLEKLPKDLALDGELWTKRDDFQKAVSIVRRQDQNDEWTQITYMVYDAPNIDKKFAQRLEIIEKTLSLKPSNHVVAHKHEICKNKEHLDKQLQEVINLKGEGLMIKDPKSIYESARSSKLLKVKIFEDTEATVYGHESGTGRCSSMLGALLVVGDNGKKFKVGSGFTDRIRRNPPKKGSRITYKFQGLTKNGLPRFPIFLREHPGM